MMSNVAAPAAEATAANGHGNAHSTAGFKALMLGSIGVVYGDIGTSPLYALREAVIAASGPEEAVNPEAVLGVLSLILWALIVVVTLKYVLILLRADNHGEGGTLALMALAQRAVSSDAGKIVLLGIIGGALFYGDAVITPAAIRAFGDRGNDNRHRGVRTLCGGADDRDPARAVCGSVARHGACCRLFRAGDVHLVRRHRDRGDTPDHATSRSASCAKSVLRRLLHASSWHYRVRDAGRGVSRGHRRRGAVRRSGAFRQAADPDRLAVHRVAVAGAELSRAGRAGHRQSEDAREPVFPDVSGLGIVSDGRYLPSSLP